MCVQRVLHICIHLTLAVAQVDIKMVRVTEVEKAIYKEEKRTTMKRWKTISAKIIQISKNNYMGENLPAQIDLMGQARQPPCHIIIVFL